MSSVNKAIILGNLGRDPETRYSQAGNPITNFSVATSEKWKDKNTGQMQESTEWHNCVCFGRTAEIAGEYLRKGSKVYIEGQLKTSSWEKDGQKFYRTEINVRELKMLSTPQSENRPVEVPAGINKAEGGPNLPPSEADWDSDIPFMRKEDV